MARQDKRRGGEPFGPDVWGLVTHLREQLAFARISAMAAKEIAHADGERASRDTVRREVGPSVCQTCFGSGHDLFDKTVACPDCHKGEK